MNKSTSQLQLTRSSDYAVRAMLQLATLRDGERILLPALAKTVDAPGSFLSKVLQALSRAGFISSRRGQFGGFAILPLGLRASIREVIEAVEGPIKLNLCLQHGPSCSRKSRCPAHRVWASAQAAMLDVLNVAIVADLASVVLHEASRPAPLPTDQARPAFNLQKPNRVGPVLLSR